MRTKRYLPSKKHAESLDWDACQNLARAVCRQSVRDKALDDIFVPFWAGIVFETSTEAAKKILDARAKK